MKRSVCCWKPEIYETSGQTTKHVFFSRHSRCGLPFSQTNRVTACEEVNYGQQYLRNPNYPNRSGFRVILLK